MAASGTHEDKRSAQRTDLVKLAFLKKDEQAVGCLLKDISLTGAQFDFIKLPGLDRPELAIGDHVQLVVDDVGEAVGTVARLPEGGVALKFERLDTAETAFIETLQAEMAE